MCNERQHDHDISLPLACGSDGWTAVRVIQ